MLVGVASLPSSFPPFGTQAFYIIKRQNGLNICNTVYLQIPTENYHLDSVANVQAVLPFYDVKCLCPFLIPTLRNIGILHHKKAKLPKHLQHSVHENKYPKFLFSCIFTVKSLPKRFRGKFDSKLNTKVIFPMSQGRCLMHFTLVFLS